MARQEDKICSLDHEIREITDQRLQSVSSHLSLLSALPMKSIWFFVLSPLVWCASINFHIT